MPSRNILAAFALALLLGFALGGSYVKALLDLRYAPAHQQHTAEKHDRASDKPVNEPDEAIAEYTLWLTVFTGLLFFATVGLGAATVGLYLTGEKQIKLTAAAFGATHRPEIIVHSFEATHDMDDSDREGVGASFTVVNKGTAEAHIEQVEGIIVPGVHYLRPGISLEDLSVRPHVLASGEARTNVAIFGKAGNAAEVFFDAGFGGAVTVKLWCLGRITYRDAAGRRRQTGFCRSFDAKRGLWANEPDSDYEYSY